MNTFFTADWHLGHENIIQYSNRPFANSDEMNDTILERYREVVSEEDTVYFLGDITLDRISTWSDTLSALPGKKILLAGNHDSCWFGHRRKTRAKRAIQDYLDAGFAEVHDSGILEARFPGMPLLLLSHLPYFGDTHEHPRYDPYRPLDEGLINVCGHVHDLWSRSGASYNVGVDVWNFYPVSLEQLRDDMQRGVHAYLFISDRDV